MERFAGLRMFVSLSYFVLTNTLNKVLYIHCVNISVECPCEKTLRFKQMFLSSDYSSCCSCISTLRFLQNG